MVFLQALHASFFGLQFLVARDFLIKGVEPSPEVVKKFGLTDINRQIYPYLTVWNLVLHIAYIIMCVAEDIVIASTSKSSLSRFKTIFSKNRAFIFETLVFPGSMLVVSAYWILTLMNPLYLFPGPIEELIPSWINFFIHSGVGIFASMEVILRNKAWSPHHRLRRLNIGCMILAFYAIAICTHRYSTGAWIYPFVEFLSWPQRVAIYFSFLVLAILYYTIGTLISIRLHGKSTMTPEKYTSVFAPVKKTK